MPDIGDLTYFRVVRTVSPVPAGVLSAEVTFEALITKGVALQADIAADVLEILTRPVHARIVDGVLMQNGTAGVLLLSAAEVAVDGGFSYLATFTNVHINGALVRDALKPLMFDARDDDTEFDLKDAAPVALSTGSPTVRGPRGFDTKWVVVDAGPPIMWQQYIAETDTYVGDPVSDLTDVQSVVDAQDIPGQVDTAVTDEVAAQDIPGQVSTAAANVIAANPDLVAAAVAQANSGAGLLSALKAAALATNRAVNPQGKGGTVDQANTSLFTQAEITTGLPAGFSYGISSVRKGANSSSVAIINFGAIAGANANSIPVTAGETISASVMLWSDDPASKTALVQLTFVNASDASVSSVNCPSTTLASSTWETRKWENVVVPALATHVRVRAYVDTASGNSTTGSTTRATGVMVNTGATVNTYADGNSLLWAWTGTPHGSISVQPFRSKADQDAMFAEAGAAATLQANLYSGLLPGKNLYNPADINALTDKYLATSSTVGTLVNWKVTGYIPVTPAQVITASKHLHCQFFDSSKAPVGSLINSGYVSATYTVPALSAYVRFDWEYDTDPTFQLELGSGATAYEAYRPHLNFTDPVLAAVDLRVAAAGQSAPLSITITNGQLDITSLVGGLTLLNRVRLAGSSNGTVGYAKTDFSGVQIADDGDDVCPIVTQIGYVGGNHGYSDPVAAFTNPDSKTNADIGSIWQDTATRQYVLLGFTTDAPPKLIMGGSYTGGTGVPGTGTPCTVAAVNPATNLTHVSGATHTGAIVYTTKVAATLRPSVGRIHVTAWLDGKQISANGTYTGSVLEVRESYEILDYKALYDYAVANHAVTADSIAGCVGITNTYRYTGAGRQRVRADYYELTPTALSLTGADCGAVQAAALSASGKTTKRYVPGMGVVNTHDWSAGVDLTSYSTDDTLLASSATVAGRIPAFSLDTLDVSGTLFCGFAMGYLPFVSDSAGRSSQRLARSASQLWLMKSTKKCYPSFTTSETTGWGHIRVDAFRCYLSPAQITEILKNKTDAFTAYGALNQVSGVE